MSMIQKISDNDQHKITYDDMNERISFEEWRCESCGEWVDADDAVWATEDGRLNTDSGKPYCDGCVPEEKDNPNPDAKWNDNAIQFPRLIAEISANVEITDKEWEDMCDSMDVTPVELEQLFNRASAEWERLKAEICQGKIPQQSS